MTTAEFELLGFLVRNHGKVLSRERIIEGTHDINWAAYDRSIDVLISRLRQKLGDDPKRPSFIRTVRGSGYSLDERFLKLRHGGGGEERHLAPEERRARLDEAAPQDGSPATERGQ